LGGQPPRNLQLDQVLLVDPYSYSGDEIGLSFDRETGHFDIDLQITAIDQNGNESAPIVITIAG
ncbi:MAG: hypothetical protein AB7L94_35345, partial [Kofleriaceae bacterium]